MTNEERSELIKRSIEERTLDYIKQTKYCPACGHHMLGGVSGDSSLVGCSRCHHITDKYLKVLR